MLSAYAIFHLNLAFSSIEESQRPDIIEKCYWPLLQIAKTRRVPLGIEATGYTLEEIAKHDPAWLTELRFLVDSGICEVIGSGYSQIIGPLVPARVNAANLRWGSITGDRLLGVRPRLALVNEQAYSGGLVAHYAEAGFDGIVMEWDNAYRFHPEWQPEWRYFPQLAVGSGGVALPLIWSKSIAFQKFQRYAHDELDLVDYLAYLKGHDSEGTRYLPLYANDAEIFDFRPGRFEAEPMVSDAREWERIGRLFSRLMEDDRIRLVLPSAALEACQSSGRPLRLESAEEPIPVKKQGKYNATRWAVSGRDDLGINTTCYQLAAALGEIPIDDERWRELLYLWSSDFRTHVTKDRWLAYTERLGRAVSQFGTKRTWFGPDAFARRGESVEHHPDVQLESSRRFVTIQTDHVRVRLNVRRGLAIDALWLGDLAGEPLCGTLRHGHFDDIGYGSDWYTGHTVIEVPGRHKVTDLGPVEPLVGLEKGTPDRVMVEGSVQTPMGMVVKRVFISRRSPEVWLWYRFEFKEVPCGAIRLGNVTLNPAAFDRSTLHYSTKNGGWERESFRLEGRTVDQGAAVSFLVSARGAVGMTDGWFGFWDCRRGLQIEVDKTTSALIGLVTYREIGDQFLCRLGLSGGELDDTRIAATPVQGPLDACLRLSAFPVDPCGDKISEPGDPVRRHDDEGAR